MDKKEMLYIIATARQFCENLDRNTTKVNDLIKEIEEEKEKFKKKENMFTGMRFWLIYVIITLVSIAPFSIFAVFTDYHIEILIPLVGLTLTLLAEKYYKKKKMPAIEKTHKQTIKNKEKSIEGIIELLYADCENYGLVLFDIPEELRYTVALDFIHESIRQDHVFSIEDSFIYYNNHIEKLKNTNTKKSKNVLQEAADSIEVMNVRNKIIEKYIHFETEEKSDESDDVDNDEISV